MRKKAHDLIRTEEAGAPRDDDTAGETPPGHRVARSSTRANGLRVLVVDDDHDTADSYAMLVRMWGHDVRVAYAGAAALQMAATRPPDLVLLDLAMPGMDGYRLARQLRGQTGGTKLVLVAITGYAGRAHRLRCDEAEFDHFLVKPTDPASLEELLRRTTPPAARAVPPAAPPRGCVIVLDADGLNGRARAGPAPDRLGPFDAGRGGMRREVAVSLGIP